MLFGMDLLNDVLTSSALPSIRLALVATLGRIFGCVEGGI